jgi:hypothetical protein
MGSRSPASVAILAVALCAVPLGYAPSGFFRHRRRRSGLVANDHEQNVVFTPVLRLKDVDYALKFARRLGIGSPFGRLAASQSGASAISGIHARMSKIIEVARLQTP